LGLLAADKPPPLGFLAFVALSFVLTLALTWMIPRWRRARLTPNCRSPRSPWVQGAAAGVVVFTVSWLLPFTGSGTDTGSAWDVVIGAAATASVFAAGAAVLARVA